MAEEQTEHQPSPAPPAKEPETDKPMTDYLILEQVEAFIVIGDATQQAPIKAWQTGPKVRARGASAAVRQHVADAGEGTYVAVPIRSWAPVTVETQTQTKLVFK